MTQWEQIKKEYGEINVPEQGKHMVLEAMAEAKKKRNRWRNLSRYGSAAAAAVLVLLLPGMLLLSGGMKSAKEDSASIEMESVRQDALNFKVGTGMENGMSYESVADAESADSGNAKVNNDSAGGHKEYATAEEPSEPSGAKDARPEWYDARKEISEEIIRQMQERMQTSGETYYIKSEERPNGFALLDGTEAFYFTEEGNLVIAFAAGKAAPVTQGISEFVIPKEVYTP